jgi:FdhD protein
MVRGAAPARRAVTAARVLALDGDAATSRPDRLDTEEPMEIRVHGPGEDPVPLAVVMRTPGHDFELAVGFCLSEGVVRAAEEVATVGYCLEGRAAQHHNVVTVSLRRPVIAEVVPRRTVAAAGCGICGISTLDDLEVRCAPVAPGPVVARSVLAGLPAQLAARQSVFDATGGLHAAARCRADGTVLAVREDVGRHNALDKLIGAAALDGSLPLASEVLVVSGRLGFELVQKAAVAGIPLLCAVSAPSSLAVAAAQRFGQTVVGFLRGDRCNIYTHAERVDLAT